VQHVYSVGSEKCVVLENIQFATIVLRARRVGSPALALTKRAHYILECQYAAGRAKTKTQMLREKIQDLESKIKQLEQGVAAKITFPDSPATTPDHENSDLFDETDFSSAPGSGSVVVASQCLLGLH